jgi:Tol biopolymer transport system component
VEFDPRTGRPTSKATKITDRYVNAGSAWSPDGKLLAYASLRDGKEPGEGEPASLVIRTMATGNERVVTPRIMLEMNLSNPQWFPDGRSLLIQPLWGKQAGKLAKVDIENGDVQLLLNGASLGHTSGSTWYDPGATLSPDGRMLYYTAGDSRTQQVRIVRRELPDSEEKEVRSLKTARVPHISVSPDGGRLAFWLRPDERDQNHRILMTMPANGGEPSQVRTGSVFPLSSVTAWSGDGKRIFFVGPAKPGADPEAIQDCDIWSVPAEGGEPVPLKIGPHAIMFFHLHPDGKRLVFYDEFSKGDLWSLKNVLGSAKASR